MLQTGQTFDRYEIDALLGSGGMASVYRARHTQLGSTHALKVLSAGTKSVRDRLLQEGRVQASLRHPNLVVVTDVLDVQGQPALVMEYVDGPSLEEWLARGHHPDLAEAVALFRGVVRGTRYAHRKGLIHRDLKPGNVLLSDTPEGMVPKIVDFGLVKSLLGANNPGMSSGPITQTGVAMGTPEYMAPEQIRDAANVDQRADLFSLGCILYTLVCGRPPFVGRDMLEIFNKVTNGEYPHPSSIVPGLPDAIAEVIERLLQVDRERRVQTCDDLLAMLDRQDLFETSQATHLHPSDALKTARSRGSREALVGVPHSENSLTHNPLLAEDDLGWRRSMWLGLVPLVLLPLVGVTAAAVFVFAGQLHRQPTVPGTPALSNVIVQPSGSSDRASRISVEDATAPAPKQPPPATEAVPSPAKRPVAAPRTKLPRKARRKGPVQVSFSGDARHVWLVANKKRYSANGTVPAGQYDILALFEGGKKPVPAGRITLKAGSEIALRCSAFSQACHR